MDRIALAEGSIFADRYKVVRPIAKGGMGAVYEVVHLETQRRCALKIMLPHILKSERMRERFRQEARITSFVQSEFLVDVLDAGIDVATEHPFLVMELLRGQELKKRLARGGRMSPAEVVTCLHQVALALDKTHRAGIVHRDLKPDNIFLTEREDGSLRIKILDFGIAKILSADVAHPNTTHEMMGTPFFMAPEQFRSLRVTPAADIYSIGMIAYTMLVGAHYWREEFDAGANVLVFAATAVRGPQEAPSSRARRRGVPLPAAFDAWFARATAPDAANRFLTASAEVAALAHALGVPTPGRAAFPSESFPQSPRNAAYRSPPETQPLLAKDLPARPFPAELLPRPSDQGVAAPPAPPSEPAKTPRDHRPVHAAHLADPHTITCSSTALTMPLDAPVYRGRGESMALAAAALAIGIVGFLLLGQAHLWAQSPVRAPAEARPDSRSLATTIADLTSALSFASAPAPPPQASVEVAPAKPQPRTVAPAPAPKPSATPTSRPPGSPKAPPRGEKAPPRKSSGAPIPFIPF
jgi:serine/threonine-protein kinase